MIRTSWNADGLLQIEISAEIAQELNAVLQTEVAGHASTDMLMLAELLQDRLLKHRKAHADETPEVDDTPREG